MPPHIQASEYNPFGQLIAPPDRPEPARVEPKRLEKKDVLKKFRWNESDYDAANGLLEGPLKFPIAGQRPNAGNWGVTLIWREDVLDAWAVRVREQIELLQRLVARAK